VRGRPPCRVSDFVAFGNGSHISQAYGDAADVGFSFFNFAGSPTSMAFWLDAYSGLERVAYGGVPVITITALGGNFVSLESFQLGAWPTTNRAPQVTVTEFGTGNVLQSTGPITVLGTTPSTFDINATSANGLQITFGPEGFNVGIDNNVYSTAPIPEPGTWALMALRLAGVAAAARRRRQGG
jgi:PEP-CTERM motif